METAALSNFVHPSNQLATAHPSDQETLDSSEAESLVSLTVHKRSGVAFNDLFAHEKKFSSDLFLRHKQPESFPCKMSTLPFIFCSFTFARKCIFWVHGEIYYQM